MNEVEWIKECFSREQVLITAGSNINQLQPPANNRKYHVINEPSASCLTNTNLACTLQTIFARLTFVVSRSKVTFQLQKNTATQIASQSEMHGEGPGCLQS